MRVFPRLSLEQGQALVSKMPADVHDCIAWASPSLEGAHFPPSGGAPVTSNDLGALVRAVRDVAQASGYPEPVGRSAKADFDTALTPILHDAMSISRFEASEPGVWSFLALRVFPDLVQWRFGPSASVDRFLGRQRGVRNTLGRLWWRAETFLSGGQGVSLDALGEDQMVQILERPTLAANSVLARAIAGRFTHALKDSPITGELLMREVVKRLRRKAAFVRFETLDASDLNELVHSEFDSVQWEASSEVEPTR